MYMIVQLNEARSKCGSLSCIISCMAKLEAGISQAQISFLHHLSCFPILFEFRVKTRSFA